MKHKLLLVFLMVFVSMIHPLWAGSSLMNDVTKQGYHGSYMQDITPLLAHYVHKDMFESEVVTILKKQKIPFKRSIIQDMPQKGKVCILLSVHKDNWPRRIFFKNTLATDLGFEFLDDRLIYFFAKIVDVEALSRIEFAAGPTRKPCHVAKDL